ncbi:lipoyl synthase [Candidatus Woesearchaeota archaeon]|nr:lipoyl synthase [Candidatus Woesearchaeota archaeon]
MSVPMVLRKPSWLRIGLPSADAMHSIKALLREKGLNSVCEEASCPNINECFQNRTACFMILGRRCTRNCSYCDVEHAHGSFLGQPDMAEPDNIAIAVKELCLRCAVITSVTRDDLADFGAGQFSLTVAAIRRNCPGTWVELLVPDFSGSASALKTVVDSGPNVLSHNIETAKELFYRVRPQGDYGLSMALLKRAKEIRPVLKTKSGMMLGMGETREMLIATLEDLRRNGVDFLTLGQYLQPSKDHWPVRKYYTLKEFSGLKAVAEKMGFLHVESAPFVRSSYHAERLRGIKG